jgi:hypothetical protein
MTKRAERRASLALKKKKAKELYPHDKCAKMANHLAACSCHMCGNPRNHDSSQKTMQERRADENEKDQIE